MVKAYEVQDRREENRKAVGEGVQKVVWIAMERKICCACRLIEFKGYLCRHALAVFLALDVLEVPSFYILKRWTKDAKSRHVLDEGYAVHGDCSETVAQHFNIMERHPDDPSELQPALYDLCHFLTTELFGYSTDQWDLLCSWPRTDLGP